MSRYNYCSIIGTKKEELQLVWTITRKCNYNCNYCSTNKNNIFFNDMSYIDVINKHKNKINLVIITGGEPTLNSNLEVIVKNIETSIKLWSNLSSPIELYLNIIKDNFEIHTSYHPEFTPYKDFIEKIRILSKHIKITCNVMISNILSLNLTLDKIEELKKYCVINYGKVVGINNYYINDTNFHYPIENICAINGVMHTTTDRKKLSLYTNLVSCDINKYRIELDSDNKFKCCFLCSDDLSSIINHKIICKSRNCSPMFLRRGHKSGLFSNNNSNTER